MSYSDGNTYEEILQRCLANDLLSDVDKRQGSIIYDSLAPLCMELAEAYIKMDVLESQSYLMTATGASLEKRVYDYGLTRKSGTYAERIGSFKKYKTDDEGKYVLDEDGNKTLVEMDVPENTRFAVPDNSDVTYIYVGFTNGHKILQCEQTGTEGNVHIGEITPLTGVTGLIEAHITGTYTPGEDDETDEELRKRCLDIINTNAFGGNISDYISYVNSIDGVGNTKVFPAWKYNGSVLLSVVDPTFNPITEEFARQIKEKMDPDESTGQGVGIAPIGHYVTVTTPKKIDVSVQLSVETDVNYELSELEEQIIEQIQEYFDNEKQSFAQNVTLAIYRARIIDAVLNVSQVVNVTNVLINGEDKDLVLYDLAELNGQNLPYLKEVTFD